MSHVMVRAAAPREALLIADLSRKTFYETFAEQNTTADMEKFMNEQFTKDALAKEVGAPGNIFLVAEVKDEIVGYARLKESINPTDIDGIPAMELARIYVVKHMKGKGVGSALMKNAIAVAYELNKKILWLGVFEKNKPAIGFYESWGFKKFGTQDFLLGNDLQKDWLMKKIL